MIAAGWDLVLARGLTDETGARHRRARLRPMDGHTEAALAEGWSAATEAARDELLADRLERLGGYAPVAPDLISRLSRADRDRLAFEIRAEVFGDRLLLTATCENPSCGEKADLDLSVSELLGGIEEATPEHIGSETAAGPVTVRPVLGLDDPDAEEIWPQLLVDGPQWPALSESERQGVALALARAEARPDLGISASCPYCGLLIEIEIDPIDLLARELRLGASRLVGEIHSIAYHYGWTETEILDLPRERRWKYLDLIRAQVTGRPLE